MVKQWRAGAYEGFRNSLIIHKEKRRAKWPLRNDLEAIQKQYCTVQDLYQRTISAAVQLHLSVDLYE